MEENILQIYNDIKRHVRCITTSFIFISTYNTIMSILVFILPTGLKPSDSYKKYVNSINKLFKRCGFLAVVIIRIVNILKLGREKDIFYSIPLDLLLFYVNNKNIGTFSIVTKAFKEKNLNPSGHMFTFSYSFYILTRVLLTSKSVFLISTCLFTILIYTFLATYTIIYHHTKWECFIGLILCNITAFIHNYILAYVEMN
ncbi:hypothetical protein CWI38_0143p0050 [Hamiltosporidium tvaerminnensis]|uniref:Uncharacterized protein n=1 Tax=Hamiltosporidium tvaerminnensis TaxID=1176355 RepID=A0A4Q9M1N7_9MICR|nr:hypothetical protein CWI38_0143p0050 [Hamiltosporidium tvaerminnensis]